MRFLPEDEAAAAMEVDGVSTGENCGGLHDIGGDSGDDIWAGRDWAPGDGDGWGTGHGIDGAGTGDEGGIDDGDGNDGSAVEDMS